MNLLGPDDQPEALGGKAAALARLRELPVPPWFAIPATAFDDQGRLDDQLRPQIQAACAALGPGPFAVRSSARDEDGGSHSFAGQLDTFLAVPAETVCERAEAVAASARSERIRVYREQQGLGEPVAPAVLVQVMVDALAAGVAFSVDPVSCCWGICRVSAVPGLGEVLVDGSSPADEWCVDRSNTITATTIADAKIAQRLHHDPVTCDAPALNDAQVMAVAALARRCAAHAGRPQDIEWAHDGSQLWLLQSRPITTLGRAADPDGEARLWDNSNIAESYGGRTTPLTFTFARDIYAAVYRQFCRLMGVPESTIQARSGTFRGLLGLMRGRMYYNLLEWYRLLACFPGFAMNRGFMEQMMGVRDGLPAALEAEIPRAGFGARLLDSLRFARSCWGLWRNHRTLPKQVRRFQARLDQALAEPAHPWHLLSPDELVQDYRRLEDALLLRWDAPLVNDFFAMIWYGLLKKTCTAWCDDADGGLQNDLLGGDGTVISAEPARRVKTMAACCRDHADLAETLRSGDRGACEAAIAAHPDLAAGVQAYLDRFADRCLEELKLESATLADDPLSLYRAIGHFAARPPAVESDPAAAARQAAEARVASALRGRPIKRLIFTRILRLARSRVANRENLRFERTRLFGRVRRIFVELGRRYAAAGVLRQPDDIFFCDKEEALGFVEGHLSCPDLQALADARRQAFAAQDSEPAPADRFTTTGWVFCGNRLDPIVSDQTDDGDPEQRRGLACCPGQVSGVVRVVRDPRGVELPAGSILVAERTDPGWIMLFPAAAALVVERGSLLSHSAIVARELGLPCVVAVPGATSWLQDGDQVSVDGATGLVRRIA